MNSIHSLQVQLLKDQFKENAEKAVKGNLILEKIAKTEKIEATEEDVEQQFKKMADMYGMEVDKIKDIMKNSVDSIKEEIVINKTLELLVENSAVKRATKKKAAEEPAAEAEEK